MDESVQIHLLISLDETNGSARNFLTKDDYWIGDDYCIAGLKYG